MSILLSEMVSKLMEDVPAQDGIPSAMQYDDAVRDAVHDFSERCGLEQIATLNIVSGTATYALPADFLRMISLQSFTAHHDYAGHDSYYGNFTSPYGVINTEAGLVPLPRNFVERNTVRNGQITFYPTPRYTMARTFRYKAAWISEATGEYGDEDFTQMSDREARIILLQAQANCLKKQSNAAANTNLKYSFGAVSEDMTGNSEVLRKNANNLELEFVAACEKYNGQYTAYGIQ